MLNKKIFNIVFFLAFLLVVFIKKFYGLFIVFTIFYVAYHFGLVNKFLNFSSKILNIDKDYRKNRESKKKFLKSFNKVAFSGGEL